MNMSSDNQETKLNRRTTNIIGCAKFVLTEIDCSLAINEVQSVDTVLLDSLLTTRQLRKQTTLMCEQKNASSMCTYSLFHAYTGSVS